MIIMVRIIAICHLILTIIKICLKLFKHTGLTSPYILGMHQAYCHGYRLIWIHDYSDNGNLQVFLDLDLR